MVGEKGRVYAFEPNPSAHTCLCYNMLKFVNVSCYQMALGETPGIGIIADSKNLNAGASMVKRTGSGDVLIMTLDSMAHKWDRLDFIKIDAEGSEPEIILGALQTLRRLRPVILIEISRQVLKYRGYTSEDITAPLNRLGYRVEPAESHLPLSGENVDAICFPR
jgi:FkbM family methyltransferase